MQEAEIEAVSGTDGERRVQVNHARFIERRRVAFETSGGPCSEGWGTTTAADAPQARCACQFRGMLPFSSHHAVDDGVDPAVFLPSFRGGVVGDAPRRAVPLGGEPVALDAELGHQVMHDALGALP